MIDEKKLMYELDRIAIAIIRNDASYEDEYGNSFKIAGALGELVGEIKGFVVEQPKVGEWIPCSERLPKNEIEVQICARHKYRDKWFYTITSAHHQDGTMHTEDSSWSWQDCDFEYCEETDDYIIAEGWWEDRHYNPDDIYNNLVDDEVVAWMPLPEPYKGV